MLAIVPIELISSADGLVDLRVALRGEEQPLVRGERPLDGEQRRLAADDERHHRVRKHDDVPQRHHRQLVRRSRGTLGAFPHACLLSSVRLDETTGESGSSRPSPSRSAGCSCCSTTSLLTTTSFTSDCEGSANIMSSISSSMIMRRPRAPILRSTACWAMRLERVVGEAQRDVLELEDLLVLLDQRVARLGQDTHERRRRPARAASPSPAAGRRTPGSCRT